MAKMKIAQALGRLLPDREAKEKLLRGQIIRADALRELILHKRWIEMSRIMDKFRNEAVKELGTKGMEERDWLRINHRMELLADIANEINAILEVGNHATVTLAKMKENHNG